MKLKNLLLISTICISAFADMPYISDSKEVLENYPVAKEYRAIDFGGTKNVIDAYQDGVGVYVGAVKQDKKINNKPLIDLISRYGKKAKENGVSLIDEVSYGSGTTEDKILLSTLFAEGSLCDDKDPVSLVSIYINGICTADKTEGTACNDGNDLTSEDKWSSGICTGIYSSQFLVFDNNYLGFTKYEADKMEEFLGLSNFDLTLIPNSHSMLNQSAFANQKHVLALTRISTGELIGGYIGENFFNSPGVGHKPATNTEFIFNLTKGIKQTVGLNNAYGIYSAVGYPFAMGGGFDFYLATSSSYVSKYSYGVGQPNILGGSTATTYFTPVKVAFYIVNPK